MDLESRIDANDTTQLIVRGDGNVGIGTSTPSSDGGRTLEVYDATTPTIKLNDGDEYKALLQLRGNDLEIRELQWNHRVLYRKC